MEELLKEYLEKFPPAGNSRGYRGRIHEEILVANQRWTAEEFLESIQEELEKFLVKFLIELLAESYE